MATLSVKFSRACDCEKCSSTIKWTKWLDCDVQKYLDNAQKIPKGFQNWKPNEKKKFVDSLTEVSKKLPVPKKKVEKKTNRFDVFGNDSSDEE